jgi:hypothetical protein
MPARFRCGNRLWVPPREINDTATTRSMDGRTCARPAKPESSAAKARSEARRGAAPAQAPPRLLTPPFSPTKSATSIKASGASIDPSPFWGIPSALHFVRQTFTFSRQRFTVDA